MPALPALPVMQTTLCAGRLSGSPLPSHLVSTSLLLVTVVEVKGILRWARTQ